MSGEIRSELKDDSETNMDVLFVDLPFNTYELGRKFKSAWSFKQHLNPHELHLGFRYMVSALRARGLTSEILYPSNGNGVRTRTDLVKAICEIQPLILAFTSYEGSFRESLQFIRRVKAKGVRSVICVGGHLATFSYQEILRDFHDLVDVVVLGEGERTIVELTEAIKSGIDYTCVPGIAFFDGIRAIESAARPVESAIDRFPFPILPERQDWSNQPIPLFITSSRGCYGHCSFCRASNLGGRWRPRDPDNVVDEIEAAYQRGISIFEFVDDNFLGPGKAGRKRAIAIAEEIKRRNIQIQYHLSCRVNDIDEATIRILNESGLFSVSLGVESGVQRMLDTFNKQISVDQSLRALEILNGLEISVQVYIIFFDPYMTLQEVRENVQFLQRIQSLDHIRFEGIVFRKLIPISGTTIFEQLKRDKLLRGNYLSGYSFRFRDPMVSVFADFMETVDLRFERIYQFAEYRNIDHLYEAFKEIFEFSFAEKALDLIEGSRMKQAEAFAKLNDLLSVELRRTFSPDASTVM
jgi:anaerobic magnesium-protoporphyrin IX monomethyl ester cyclase